MISKGQTLLREILVDLMGDVKIEENFRPPPLLGMELDFWIPRFRLAFEFNGDQHFAPCFGIEPHLAQVRRDKLKRRICMERKVVLVQVEAIELFHKKVKNKIWINISMKRLDLTKGERKGLLRQVLYGGRKIDRRAWLRKYREYIKALRKFDSPTTRKKRCKPRLAAIEAIWQKQLAS